MVKGMLCVKINKLQVAKWLDSLLVYSSTPLLNRSGCNSATKEKNTSCQTKIGGYYAKK